ncbi:unnamed protein product [Scytosiphon promiscuus]
MASHSPSARGNISTGNAHLKAWAQQYSVETEPLGRGSFASVYKGINRDTKEPVAIKVMTKARLGERALKMLSAEINILRTLEHPNVVCLRDSHTAERRILIVLEFCGGGDLGQFIQSRGPSPEATARHFMLQLAAGLAFLRSRRLIHRDIKPQNLLLSDHSSRALLKIADFGLARHLPQGSLAESMLGSPLYMAPEVLSNRAYDAKADLWSAGAVLYELVTAKHPFGGTNQVELINNIRRNRPRLPPGVTLSPACVELLGMLLVPQPEQRASLPTFLSCSFLNPPAATAAPGPGRTAGVAPGTAVAPRESGVVVTDGGFARTSSAHRPERRQEPPSQRQESAGGGEGGGEGGGAFSSEWQRQQQQQQQRRRHQQEELAATNTGRTAGEPISVEDHRQKQPCHAVTAASTGEDGAAAQDTTGAAAAATATAAASSGLGCSSNGATATPPAAAAAAGNLAPPASAPPSQEVGADPVGGRDGEWGWDWGGGGLVPALAGGEGLSGQGGAVARIGVNAEGPLPSLPALPFALGPFGARRSFDEAEAGGGGGGGGRVGGDNAEGSAGFAFDLAFAESPAHGRSRMVSEAAVLGVGGGGERVHRCYSASDAVSGERERVAGPDRTRRKHHDAAAPVTAGQPPAETAAAPGQPAGPAVASGGDAPAAAGAGTPTRRRRRHSFSGKNSPPRSALLEGANTLSDSRGSPDAPVVGQHPRHHPGAGGGPRNCRSNGYDDDVVDDAGASTPPSPVFYTSVRRGDYASADGVGGNAGGSPSGGGGGGAFSAAPSRSSSPSSSGGASLRVGSGGGVGGGQVSPAHAHGDPAYAVAGGNQALVPPPSTSSASCGDGGQQQAQQQAQEQAGSVANPQGGGGGSSNGPAADLGVPVLLKPSFRGSDSLLTIPEDSTGFVLVTRPSSVSCEHGPNCECWAWSGGGGGAVIRSPSASYLAAANPYGGPGKVAAGGSAGGNGGGGGGRRSGAGTFLGLGNFWNTAVNTFRGVAGAHARRTSWPAVVGRGRASAAGQHGRSATPPTAAASPVHSRGVSSPREQQQHQQQQQQQQQQHHHHHHLSPRSVSAFSKAAGSAAGSPSDRRAVGGVGGVGVTARNNSCYQPQGVGDQPVADANGSDHYADTSHYGSTGGSGGGSGGSQHYPTHQHPHHYRRHSEPTHPIPTTTCTDAGGAFNSGGGPAAAGGAESTGARRGYSSGGGRGNGSFSRSPGEFVDAQRVQAAAERAEVVGKRAILMVTLADKTAQEAMALALESPVRAEPAAGAAAAAVAGGVARATSSSRRQHDMLTEALSLYVKALALLQGALPGVLVECEGALPTEGFAPWDPLGGGMENRAGSQNIHPEHQQQQQQQWRSGRPSPVPPPTPAFLAERSALVTKAAWLKELFSQTLQRAEHCRAQAACAAGAAAAAAAAAPLPPSASSPPEDGDVAAAPGSGAGFNTGNNPAAAAVYRSAVEHGQEAAVCYLLGRSEAAVTHYVRACALLQLLAFEPEMAVAGAGSGAATAAGDTPPSPLKAPATGQGGSDFGGRGGDGCRYEAPQRLQQQQASSAGGGGDGRGWREHLLGMADAYAQRVELISRGDAGGGGELQR